MSAVEAFGHTDVGRSRPDNQDSYLCVPLGREPWGHLLAVADGMGGHAGGEVASEIAITVLRSRVVRTLATEEATEPEEVLRGAFGHIHREILRRAREEEDLAGMGTTLVAALVTPRRAWVANVGDSRAYLIDGTGIGQLTSDHSWAAERARSQGLEEDEIEASPFRGMLTRCLGTGGNGPEVDVHRVELRDGQYLLLCSDGLYRELDDADLARIVGAEVEPERICQEVIASANRAGGGDNVTCVVARLLPSATRPLGEVLHEAPASSRDSSATVPLTLPRDGHTRGTER